MKKILLLANTDWYLYNFRLPLLELLRGSGYDLLLASPGGRHGPKLREKGFRWEPVDFPGGAASPLAEARLLSQLVRLYRRERPGLCHHFTIRAVLYGSLAARLSGDVPTVNAMTGLGHLFTDRGLKARTMRAAALPLYRSVLGRENTRVVFQNSYDRDTLVGMGIVSPSTARVIRSSGIDCRHFRPEAPPGDSGQREFTVLFAARMLREKGVDDLLGAARILNGGKERVRIVLAGDTYRSNPSSLTRAEIDGAVREGLVTYAGHVDDVRPLIASSDVVVLPSYREGTPRILAEAAAMGKPVVATDIPGCRGLVRPMENGVMVPVGDPSAIAQAIAFLASKPELRETMGAAGRKIVLEGFDVTHVNEKTLAVYGELTPL